MTEVMTFVKISEFYEGTEAEPSDSRELYGVGNGYHSANQGEPMI